MTSKAHYVATAEMRYRKLAENGGLSALAVRGHESIKLTFVRGRIADPTNLTPTENHFSYPPADKCGDYGRANIPHYPVLYAGETPAVIAEELGISPNSWLHLAIFYTPDPVNFEYLVLLHDMLSSENRWSTVREELHHHLTEQADLPAQVENVWSRMQEASALFRGPDYADTSAIAYHWLYTQGLDAILYPSARNDRWCNFALHPRFADRLRQYCVLACHWTGSVFELHHTGRPSDTGQLRWEATTREDWQQFKSTYSHLTSGA
ncbi:MAG: RES domain-containing protein [Holophaga sp.]|nr:RES domain-containing protein [Holophaga sp.]